MSAAKMPDPWFGAAIWAITKPTSSRPSVSRGPLSISVNSFSRLIEARKSCSFEPK